MKSKILHSDDKNRDKEREKYAKKTAKVKAQAIKKLQASDETFALLLVEPGKRNSGIRIIMGGVMSLEHTIMMAESLRSLSDDILEQALGGLREEFKK